MSSNIADAAIRLRLGQFWVTRFPEIPLFEENQSPNIPAGPFASVMVVIENEQIAAWGGGPSHNMWQVEGRIEVRLFVPLNSGTSFLRTMQTEVSKVFRGKRFAEVQCYGAFPFGGGERADRGKHYFTTVLVDFIYRHVG